MARNLNEAMAFIKRATARADETAKTVLAREQKKAGTNRNTGHRIIEGFHNAYAMAAAHYEAQESLRGNKIACLQTGSPATAIVAGASTGSLQVLIKEGRYIRSFHATAADELNFLCTRFAVNGYDVLDGNPINLSNFLSTLEHIDRFGPLTGRRWNSAVLIEANFINIAGGPALFHGINILMTDSECNPAGKKADPAPGFYSFGRVVKRIRLFISGKPLRR